MNILVMDAQGGKIGKQIVSAIKEAFPNASLTAAGLTAQGPGKQVQEVVVQIHAFMKRGLPWK